MADFWLYFKEGLFHVLDWNAYDHILFFIVLTVPYTFSYWRKLVSLVTIFTVGHMISLALSVYGVVKIDTSLIEFLIPITILFTAIFNIFTGGRKAKKGAITVYYTSALLIGLVHGFGFSTYFKMMTAGRSDKLLPLLEYTLGIEAAQLIVVLIVLIISFIFQAIFRFSVRDWVMVISAVVVGLVIPMLVDNWQNFT